MATTSTRAPPLPRLRLSRNTVPSAAGSTCLHYRERELDPDTVWKTVADLVLSQAPPRPSSSRKRRNCLTSGSFVRDLFDRPQHHSSVLALAVSTGLAPSKLPNIRSSFPLSSNHASVLHRYRLRFGTALPAGKSRHKLCSWGNKNRR